MENVVEWDRRREKVRFAVRDCVLAAGRVSEYNKLGVAACLAAFAAQIFDEHVDLLCRKIVAITPV